MKFEHRDMLLGNVYWKFMVYLLEGQTWVCANKSEATNALARVLGEKKALARPVCFLVWPKLRRGMFRWGTLWLWCTSPLVFCHELMTETKAFRSSEKSVNFAGEDNLLRSRCCQSSKCLAPDLEDDGVYLLFAIQQWQLSVGSPRFSVGFPVGGIQRVDTRETLSWFLQMSDLFLLLLQRCKWSVVG